MKSVLAIVFSFPPDTGSGSLRNLKILKYLPDEDWDVQLLTHQYSQPEFEQGKNLVAEIPDSIHVIRTHCIDTPTTLGALRRFFSPFRKNSDRKSRQSSDSVILETRDSASAGSSQRSSALKRLKDFVTYCLSIPDRRAGWLPFAVWAGIRTMRQSKPDVIYCVGRPWTSFFVGYLLKVIFRKPLVLDFMDPWGACTWSWSKPRVFQWIDLRLERFVTKRADYIVANTDTLRDDFIERLSLPAERVSVITCGYDVSDFDADFFGHAPTAPQMPKSNARLTITHTGSFYKRRSPLPFLKAVKKLLKRDAISSENFQVNFVGRNSVRDPKLDSLLKEPWVSEIVNFVPWIPHVEVMEYLRTSDLLLLIQPDTKLQIPAKLYEYAATRKPILALSDVDGAVDRIICREGWGEVVTSDDVDAIERSLEQFVELHGRGKLACRSHGAQQYSTQALAKNLATTLGSFVKTDVAKSNCSQTRASASR